eukprot:6380851-Pyramimonas_sp.AAC.1
MLATTLAGPPTPWAATCRLCPTGTSTYLRPCSASACDSRFRAWMPTRSLPAPGSTSPWHGSETRKVSSSLISRWTVLQISSASGLGTLSADAMPLKAYAAMRRSAPVFFGHSRLQ